MAASGLPWYYSPAAYVSCMAGEVLWYLVGMGLSFSAKRPCLFQIHLVLSALWAIGIAQCVRQ